MTTFNYSCVFNEENKLQWDYYKQGTEKSQTVGLIAHTWGSYSLSWLTGLFKCNSNAPMTLNHLSLFCYWEPFFIQNPEFSYNHAGWGIKGSSLLIYRDKSQFLLSKLTLNCPFDANGVHLSQLGGGRWMIFNTYASVHTVSSMAGGSAETLKLRASFSLCPWLKCSLGWRYLRYISSQIERQGKGEMRFLKIFQGHSQMWIIFFKWVVNAYSFLSRIF